MIRTGEAEKIIWEIIIPDPHEPNNIKPIARVFNGKVTNIHEFNRGVPIGFIEMEIRRMYKIKTLQIAPKRNRITRYGIELAAIFLDDGCFISVNHDEIISKTITLKKARNNMKKLIVQLEQRKANEASEIEN